MCINWIIIKIHLFKKQFSLLHSVPLCIISEDKYRCIKVSFKSFNFAYFFYTFSHNFNKDKFGQINEYMYWENYAEPYEPVVHL